MRVLVADDSDMYRKMLRTLLEEWGYEVVLAANGHEAQAILDRHRCTPAGHFELLYVGTGADVNSANESGRVSMDMCTRFY